MILFSYFYVLPTFLSIFKVIRTKNLLAAILGNVCPNLSAVLLSKDNLAGVCKRNLPARDEGN